MDDQLKPNLNHAPDPHFEQEVRKHGLTEAERFSLMKVMAKIYKYDIPYNPNSDVQARVIRENRPPEE